MNGHMRGRGGQGFALGLLAGTVVGAALAMYFAPKARAEIRKRVRGAAKDLGDAASECYEEVSTHLGDTVEEVASRGQKVRDAAADVVARGAHGIARGAREVERFAEAVTKAAR